MVKNNMIVVEDMDSRYSIVAGYRANGETNPNMVYDNEEEAIRMGGGKLPLVGFILFDKETGGWAEFAHTLFATCDEAIGCYYLHVKRKPQNSTGLPILQLDKNYALVLANDDPEDDDRVTDSYAFFFYDLQTDEIVFPEVRFESCQDAIAYYQANLMKKEDEEKAVITDFKDQYAFLGNGFDQKDFSISFAGRYYRTAEGAFQSGKCPNPDGRLAYCSAREAKKIGRSLPLRKDWNDVRDMVMYDVLMAKFSQNDELRQMLLDTGDARIEPHNTKHDNYWGSCDCAECASKEKKNKLGILLMRVRQNLQT